MAAETSHHDEEVKQAIFVLRGMIHEMVTLAQKVGASQTATMVLAHICKSLLNLNKGRTGQR